MNEFKKGDIIRGLKDNGYIYTNEDMLKAEVVECYIFSNEMKIRIINHIDELRNVREFNVCNDARKFELIENETIVIYRKGREVVAMNKVTGEKAKARCCPEDEFDFYAGAKIALDRLAKPTVDDTVKIINVGCVYSRNYEWIEKCIHSDEKYMWDRDKTPDTTHKFKILFIAPHQCFCNKTIAYIEDAETKRCYMIGLEGLKKCL